MSPKCPQKPKKVKKVKKAKPVKKCPKPKSSKVKSSKRICKKIRTTTDLSIYIHKLFRQRHSENKMSKNALVAINNLLRHTVKTISKRTARVMGAKKVVVQDKYIETAVNAVMLGELSANCNAEGVKVASSYGSGSDRQGKSGLILSVARIETIMRNISCKKMTAQAPVYMAGVIEYLCGEIIDSALIQMKNAKRKTVSEAFVRAGIENDKELNDLFAHQLSKIKKVTPKRKSPKKVKASKTKKIKKPKEKSVLEIIEQPFEDIGTAVEEFFAPSPSVYSPKVKKRGVTFGTEYTSPKGKISKPLPSIPYQSPEVRSIRASSLFSRGEPEEEESSFGSAQSEEASEAQAKPWYQFW